MTFDEQVQAVHDWQSCPEGQIEGWVNLLDDISYDLAMASLGSETHYIVGIHKVRLDAAYKRIGRILSRYQLKDND